MDNLKGRIEQLLTNPTPTKAEVLNVFTEVRNDLELGKIRAAEKINGAWVVNLWVKSIILFGFKFGSLTEIDSPTWRYFDKDTMPLQHFSLNNNIRLVPGGTSIRSGSYIAPGTIVMPPSYINIGAYIDQGCLVDSHALIGCCAQVGKNVHISSASQIGGVLEPAGALPVIIEDNAFIGGNCGIYEGVIIQEGAVLGSGVILNASTSIFDSITGKFISPDINKRLIVPANAVVVAGSRPLQKEPGKTQGIHIYCPVIIKYRDDKTTSKVDLEQILRTCS